jgi:hypothetical protein
MRSKRVVVFDTSNKGQKPLLEVEWQQMVGMEMKGPI